MDVPPSKILGDMSPCPIGIDTPVQHPTGGGAESDT